MARFIYHLQQTTRNHLLAIGRAHQLSHLPWNDKKPRLASALNKTLTRPTYLHPLLAKLCGTDQAILRDLRFHNGRLPRRYLTRRYGQIRPLRRQDLSQRPWENPISALERLWYLGLVMVDPASELAVDYLVLPEEVLTALKSETPALAQPPAPSPDSTHRLVTHDLALLLGLIQRDAPTLHHQRWLPPQFLKQWAALSPVAPAHPTARSELQTNRRRFIHYLAERAGFVTDHWSLVIGK